MCMLSYVMQVSEATVTQLLHYNSTLKLWVTWVLAPGYPQSHSFMLTSLPVRKRCPGERPMVFLSWRRVSDEKWNIFKTVKKISNHLWLNTLKTTEGWMRSEYTGTTRVVCCATRRSLDNVVSFDTWTQWKYTLIISVNVPPSPLILS